MRHVTISTTGVFNTIRSSLVPADRGKGNDDVFAWLGF